MNELLIAAPPVLQFGAQLGIRLDTETVIVICTITALVFIFNKLTKKR